MRAGERIDTRRHRAFRRTLTRRASRLLAAALAIVVHASATSAQSWQALDGCCGNAIVATPDGGYALLDLEGITKLDADGRLVWTQACDTPGYLSLRHIAVSSDGTLAAVGTHGTAPVLSLRCLVVDANGSVIATREMGPTTGVETGISATPDGGFVIVAPDDVIKLSRTAQVEWIKRFRGLFPRAVTALPDGRIVVAGASWAGSVLGTEVFVLDSAGNMTWRLRDPWRVNASGFGARMTLGPDGDVFLLSQSFDANGDLAASVIRLRPGVGERWSRLLRAHPPGIAQPQGIGVLDDGTVACSAEGGWLPRRGAAGAWVFGLSQEGEVLWQRSMTATRGTWGAAAGHSGRFVLSLQTLNPANAEAFCSLTPDGWGPPEAGMVTVSARVEYLVACNGTEALVTGEDVTFPVTDLACAPASGTSPLTSAPPSCSAIECDAIVLDAGSIAGGALLRLEHDGGIGDVTVSWDIDGDGAPDLTGNPALAPLAAGPHDVTAIAVDACPSPGPTSCTLTGSVTVPDALPAQPGDTDGDGACDAVDDCPADPDPLQRDTDGDGSGDACDADADGDGIGNASDDCPLVPDPLQVDADTDGVGDACDVCPGVSDPAQADTDGDGAGDACDTCRLVADPSQQDGDADGFGDACDGCPTVPNPSQSDGDADGVQDACDDCPVVPNPGQEDGNGNGLGDACDPACGEPSALDRNPSATPLRVARAAASDLLVTWELLPDAVTNLYAGDITGLRFSAYSHAAVGACDVANGRATIAMLPWDTYYLAANRCSGIDSSLGRDSLGRERPPASPPCP